MQLPSCAHAHAYDVSVHASIPGWRGVALQNDSSMPCCLILRERSILSITKAHPDLLHHTKRRSPVALGQMHHMIARHPLGRLDSADEAAGHNTKSEPTVVCSNRAHTQVHSPLRWTFKFTSLLMICAAFELVAIDKAHVVNDERAESGRGVGGNIVLLPNEAVSGDQRCSFLTQLCPCLNDSLCISL